MSQYLTQSDLYVLRRNELFILGLQKHDLVKINEKLSQISTYSYSVQFYNEFYLNSCKGNEC